MLMFITVVISLLVLLTISVKLMTFKKDSVSVGVGVAMATFADADHLADGRLSVGWFIGVSNLRVSNFISWLWIFHILKE